LKPVIVTKGILAKIVYIYMLNNLLTS